MSIAEIIERLGGNMAVASLPSYSDRFCAHVETEREYPVEAPRAVNRACGKGRLGSLKGRLGQRRMDKGGCIRTWM